MTISVRNETILIIDDEPANIQLLIHVLSKNGYRNLHSTNDPREALALQNTALCEWGLGDLPKALDHFAHALDLMDARAHPDLFTCGEVQAPVGQRTVQVFALADQALELLVANAFVALSLDPIERLRAC